MNFLLNNRKLIILITVILTVLVAFGIFGMKVDSSITAVLSEDNPDFLYNQEISKTFTSSEEIIISILTTPEGVDPKDLRSSFDLDEIEPSYSLYSVPNIELINRVTNLVLSMSQVLKSGVNSLITIANQYDQDGNIKYTGEITEETVAWVKKSVETNPMSKGKIINDAHTNTIITVPIPEKLSYQDTELNDFLSNLEVELNKIFADYPNTRYELTGQPKVKADITKYIMADISFLLPIAILVVMIAIFFMTQSFRATLIPLIVTILSVVWTFGLKGLLGLLGSDMGALTLTESVLPVVLISVACAEGIHITNQSLYFIDRGVPGKAAVYDAMQLVRLPVILSAVTTAVGFGSLVFSPGRSLKNMGIFLAFGVIIAMVFSLILIPVLISFFKTKRFSERRSNRNIESRFDFTQIIRPLTEKIIRKKWMIVIITILLIAISIPATLNIRTDQDEVRFFIPKAPVRIATENIEKNLGGISTMYLIAQSVDEFPLIPRTTYKKNQKDWTQEDATLVGKSLDQLRAFELIQERAEMEKAVSYTTSYVSYLQLINYLFKGKLNQENYILPNSPLYFSKFTITNFEQQSMVGDELTQKFITPIGDMLNINIRIQDSNTSSMQKVVNDMDEFICKLYQLDKSVLKDYYRLTTEDAYTPEPKSTSTKIKGDQMIHQIQWMQNEAKRLKFKTVEDWYQYNRFAPAYKNSSTLSPDQYFLDLQRLAPRPDFSNDFELRMIADQFSVKNLKNLAENPIRFRWAGDYIRIVNGSIIIESQIISLFTATIIILLLLAVIFKSLLTGFLLSIPVILAIFLNFTVMWLFGISLNPATSIVASVGMGVGIDYSIHYYSRFKKIYQISHDYKQSLIEGAVQSSSGIIFNALAVAIGFLVLYLSKYTIIKQMGLIVALTMITSAVGALTILPALFALFKPKVSTRGSSI